MSHGVAGSGTTTMLNLLKRASKAQLDAIDERIVTVEAELKGLRALRDCFAEKVLDGKATITVVNMEDMKLKVAKFLRFGGPTSTAGIKAQFELDTEEMKELMDDKMFEMDNRLWRLTPEGIEGSKK